MRLLLILEGKQDPLLGRRAFIARMFAFIALVCILVGPSLFVGMLGYRYLEGVSWMDAFTDAAMTLAGMGPFTPAATTAGRLFAGFYALYCGLMFIVVAGLILTPIAHRVLHRLHVEE